MVTCGNATSWSGCCGSMSETTDPSTARKPRPECRGLLGVQRQYPQPRVQQPIRPPSHQVLAPQCCNARRSRTLPPGPAGGQSGPTLARFALASSTRAAVSAATPTLLPMDQRSHDADADPGDERFRNRDPIGTCQRSLSSLVSDLTQRLLCDESTRADGSPLTPPSATKRNPASLRC